MDEVFCSTRHTKGKHPYTISCGSIKKIQLFGSGFKIYENWNEPKSKEGGDDIIYSKGT